MTEIQKGLAFFDALNRKEQTAFLALFGGASFPWTMYDDGKCPFIGKAECEWVENWRDFYSKRLVDAGLFYWEEGDSGLALGMVLKDNGEYHTWTKVDCGPTNLGLEVRNAYWNRRK